MLQPYSRSRLVVTVLRLALAALIAVPAVASAQTITGQITGRVTDASGGMLPGVTVTVVNENTGLKETRVTDVSGRLSSSPTCRSAPTPSRSELEGFRKVQRTGFSLTADGRVSADFSLGSARCSESVEVTAVMGETVNRTSGEVARTIDSQQIKDLAFNGRNYLELASLIPGAVATDYDPLALATSLSVTGQSINGNRGNTNNLTVDGGSNLDSGLERQPGQQRQPELHRSGQDPDVELLGRARPQQRRRHQRRHPQRHQSLQRYRAATTCATRRSTSPTTSPRATPTATAPSPSSSSATSRRASAVRSSSNKLFFFGGQQYRVINRFTTPSRQTMPTSAELERRLRVPPARHRRDCRHRRRRRAARSGDRTAVSRQPHSGAVASRPTAAPSPTPTPDDRARVGVHELDRLPTTRPTSSTTRSNSGRTSSASTGRRPTSSASTAATCTTSTTCSIPTASSPARRCRRCRPTGRVPARATTSATPTCSVPT